MTAVFSVIFWIALLRIIIPIIKGAQNQKDTTNSAAFRKARETFNTFSPNNTYYTQKRQSRKERDAALLKMENKDNDWLAKQLRAERQAQIVVSDMFQLKQEHANHCESEMVRAEHFNNCEAQQVRYSQPPVEQARQSNQRMSQAEMDALKERIRQRNS